MIYITELQVQYSPDPLQATKDTVHAQTNSASYPSGMGNESYALYGLRTGDHDAVVCLQAALQVNGPLACPMMAA